MSRKQKIIVSITGIVLVTLILVGLTYGYFLTKITGNTNEKSISVTTADVSVLYEDGNGVVTMDKMMPGDSFTKTFNVKNTGTSVGKYAISLTNVINEFKYFSDITYTLKRNGTLIKSGIFPSSDRKIVFNENIDPPVNNVCNVDNGCINEYELTVSYINANYDQSEDMNKKMSALVQIENKEDVIEINNENQIKALSRILTYTQNQTADYLATKDAKILGIETNENNQTISNKFQNYSYELTADIDLSYNNTFGDDYFFMIGNDTNKFQGNFYGNNHVIQLSSANEITLSGLYNSFGLFGSIKNANIYDLELNLKSNINIGFNVMAKSIGLLCGKSYNSNMENITFNLNSYNYTVNQDSSQIVSRRNDVYLGLLSGELTESNNIRNITFNINNSNIGTKTEVLTDSKYHYMGLITGTISSNNNNRNIINNVVATVNNSKLYVNTEGTYGKIGGLVGNAAYVDINNTVVKLNNSSIKITSTNNTNTTYLGITAGGIVGFANHGSDNTNNIGAVGVTIKNSKFISENDNKNEVISAKENSGGGVNAGGIAGLAFNNALIDNCYVSIKNGIIIAERSEEGSTEAGYGAHSGGIVGRLEHTSRINSSTVEGNNLDIISSSTEKYNYAGGLAGVVLGPIHRDIIPLEDNKVIGNGSTNIYLKLKKANYDNKYNYIGALTGIAYYIVKNNEVSNLNVYVNSLNSEESTSIGSYASNYIGNYYNKTNHTNDTTYFTGKTSEIINSRINNVNVIVDDYLKKSIKVNNY